MESTVERALGASMQDGRLWLCLVAGTDRAFGGHDGYDDDPSSRYVSDHTIANTRNLREGDVIVIWDKKRALGVSVIDRIDLYPTVKTKYHCPACGSTSIKARRNRAPRYRCQERDCRTEFAVPNVSHHEVTTYATYHEPGWVASERNVEARELRELCESPGSQHSIRELNRDRTMRRLGGLIERATRLTRTDLGWGQIPGGHSARTVRVRIGQAAFRTRLIDRYADSCAITGAAPLEALEAAHLYSYAKVGEHHDHGGLLLRRDVHRLFDSGLILVDPSHLTLVLDPRVEVYPAYRALNGSKLRAAIGEEQRAWLSSHWLQFDGARLGPRPVRS